MKREFNQLKWEEALVFQGPQGYETGSQQTNMGTTLILSNQSDKHCYEYKYIYIIIMYEYQEIKLKRYPAKVGSWGLPNRISATRLNKHCFFFRAKNGGILW